MSGNRANLEIRALKAGDISEIKRIEIESSLAPWSPDDYLVEAGRRDSLSFTAKIEDNIVGFIIARLIMTENFHPALSDEFNTPEGLKSHKKNDINIGGDSNSPVCDYCEIEIYNLCVAKAHRRSRIAEKLLENVIEAAPCAEKHIWLEVRKSNSAAVSFYRSMNFVERGIRKNFYRAPTEDALIMELLPKRELPNKAA